MNLVSPVTLTQLMLLLFLLCLLRNSEFTIQWEAGWFSSCFIVQLGIPSASVNHDVLPPTVLRVLCSTRNPAQYPKGVMSSRCSGRCPAEGMRL